MKKRIGITILSVVALATSGQAVAQTEVPNTFEAGQPARAAEVNANFDQLENAIDANAVNIGVNDAATQANSDAIATVAATSRVMVKANGQVIGAFLQSNREFGRSPLGDLELWVLSDTGYLFGVVPHSNPSLFEAGDILKERVRFTDLNCTGQAYVEVGLSESVARFQAGYVFTSEDPNNPTPVFYSPVGSTVVENVQHQSATFSDNPLSSTGDCVSDVGTIAHAIAVLPNDPLITGVPNQRSLGAPITLGYQ